MKSAESQKGRWDLLTKQYRERGVALILGAGVSTGCNLPCWSDLLKLVANICWGTRGRARVNELIGSGMSLPTIAGLLEAERPRGTRFSDLLREALYKDFPFTGILKTAAERKRLVELVRGKRTTGGSSTMRAVAAFCAIKQGGSYVANPGVCAVITSNVDAVLRTYVRARYGEWLLRTIETAKHNQRVGRISTYYMHGFLHFNLKMEKTDEEQTPTVFTESEYFDFFNRPHSAFNYTFLYTLREVNCVFIGMSMRDQNIRRLLHYSVAERRGITKTDPRRTGLRHFALLRRSKSTKTDDLADLSLRLLGTRVLWIDSFKEIPQRLGEVYGKSAWHAVYD